MRFAAALLLLLSGCGQSHTSTSERAEVADVNARNALEKIAELEKRVDDLEASQKGDASNLDARVAAEETTRKAVDGSLAKSIDDLSDKHNELVGILQRQR